MPVALAELNGGDERHRRVAVLERMVLDQVRAQHGGLDRELGVEVLAAEGGQRRVQRRVREVEAGLLGDALGRDLEHGLGNEEEVGQFQCPHRGGLQAERRVGRHRFNRWSARSFWRMAPASRRKKARSARRRRTAELRVGRGVSGQEFPGTTVPVVVPGLLRAAAAAHERILRAPRGAWSARRRRWRRASVAQVLLKPGR